MSDSDSNPLANLIQVRADDHAMTAFVTFVQASANRITSGDIMDMLNNYGIRYGADEKLIHQAITSFNENMAGNLNREFPVAKGNPMDPGEDGRLEFFIKDSAPVAIDESGKADFRNIEKFRTVQDGQELVKIYPARKGSDGFNVYGERIAAPEVNDPRIQAGENVRLDMNNNILIATATGIFDKKKSVVSVLQILEIKGNVGLESGNLKYEGVIKVKGNIERGAEVVSASDIFVEGLIESGSIKAGGSLTVTGGINTKNDGLLQIKKEVTASFIENSRVYSLGQVTVVSAIIGSTVISCSDITVLKDGGKIVGGEITALKHVVAGTVGNMSETPTVINIGAHFQYKKLYDKTYQEFQEAEEKYHEAIEKVKSLKDYIQRMKGKIPAQKTASIKTEFAEFKALEANYKKLEEKLNILKIQRYVDGDAFLSVKDILYPGVTIHYFNHTEKIEKEYKHCTLRFKKSEARMVLEPFSPPEHLLHQAEEKEA